MNQTECPLCSQTVEHFPGEPPWKSCAQCGAMVFKPVDVGPQVLIAHKSDEICQQMGAILVAEGFHPLRAVDGTTAKQILDIHRPPCAVLDVGLEKVMFFDLIQHMRAETHLKGTKVVLIASVYSHTSYKRTPSNLYGADDYVEQHHIQDKLPAKLKKLLDLPEQAKPHPTEQLITDTDGKRHLDRHGDERVRAMAETIVADIAMYCQEAIETILRTGDRGPLAGTLSEGRHLLEAMAGKPLQQNWDPIREAFDALLVRLRK